MPSGAKWKNADKVARNIVGAAGKMTDRWARAQYLETEVEAEECKRRCPVRTGNLRDTIHVTGPEVADNRIVTSIVCGGPAAPYAPAVHEDLEAFHPNGEAKFIEGPVRESAPFMKQRIARRARSL